MGFLFLGYSAADSEPEAKIEEFCIQAGRHADIVRAALDDFTHPDDEKDDS